MRTKRHVSLNLFSNECCFFVVTWCISNTVEGIKVEEKHIPVFKPQGEIPIRIYTPELRTPEETFPVLVDLHGMPPSTYFKVDHIQMTFFFIITGSAFCVGDLDTDELKCRAVCQKHRIVVVNVDYRLAPEFPWPIGIDDSYDAVRWVSAFTYIPLN